MPGARLRIAAPSCCATQPAGHLPQFTEPCEQFLFGPFADAAGIDDYDVRVGAFERRFVTGLLEQTGHAL